ncbi:unnamed protein product, partial [Adineta steineri]
MVEVRVHCVGINSRDVLKSRGLDPHARTFAQSDENQPKLDRDTELGSDFVSTIVCACPTTNFQVGDHVVGVTGDGAYHSHIVINSQLIIRIPPDFPLTDEQLCGMPTPLLTVIYSLKYRVHLQVGQTVLIHAATGAAGQMCVQYYQYIGARVIAQLELNRNASFANNIRQILPQGVDVIVNSVSCNLLRESIKLSSYHDCSFHVIDFTSLADHVSPLIRLMLEEVIDLIIQRKLHAVELTVSYEPSQVIEALLRCNSGQVMVVSDNTMLSLEVCNQETILISGSFGLTVLKRTTKEYNAHIDVVQADVTNFQQVHDLIERFNKTSYPIRGIIHSAVVAEDRTLNNLTQEHLSLVLPPKVRGAWYLHQATQLLHAPIHFFIMFSSIRNHLLEVSSAGYNA